MHAIQLINHVAAHLDGLRRARVLYGARISPNFNFLEFLNINENLLSRVLADLLSPNGSHNQGDKFLNLFLEHFDLKTEWTNSADVKVETETLTDYGRRIDITISFEGKVAGCIGIENKPWAFHQKNQIRDYIDELERKYKENCLLIHLSAKGDDAPSESTAGNDYVSNGRLKNISYQQLIGWLQRCIGVCQSTRIRFVLDEYIDYISKNFDGVKSMEERAMIVDAACQDKASLGAAMEIANAANDIKSKLLEKLWMNIKDHVVTNHPDWVFTSDCVYSYDSKYKGCHITFSHLSSYKLAFEFDNNGCNGPYIGLKRKAPSETNGKVLFDLLQDVYRQGKSTPNWIWWRFYGVNWEQNPEIWTKILDGSMAESIYKDLLQIYNVIKAAGKLDVLD